MFEELLNSIVLMLLCVLLLGLLLKKLNQPYFVAYIFTGILLGPYAARVFTDRNSIVSIGELGLIIQMFFTGAEIEVYALAKKL